MSGKTSQPLDRLLLVIKLIPGIVLWGVGLWYFWILASSLYKFLISTSIIEIILNGKNINRLGLIFQFVGLLAVFPELLRRSNSQKWERWFHSISEQSQNVQFSIKDLIFISPLFWLQTRGVTGLVNIISKGFAFFIAVTNVIPLVWSNAQAEPDLMGEISVFFLALFYYGWLIMTVFDVSFAMRGIKPSRDFQLFYGLTSFTLIISAFIFIPIALLVLVVLNSLRGIAKYPIDKILARATFPFVFLGMLLEFIASFL